MRKQREMGTIDEAMKTTFGNDKHRMLANIVFTGGWIKNQFTDSIKPFGLSSPQFNVLRILRGAGDWLNMNEVKNRMVEKSPNTTRLCDKLIDKGLIERTRSEKDRRVVYLKLTKQGFNLLKEIDLQDDGSKVNYINNLSDEQVRTLNELLDQLRG